LGGFSLHHAQVFATVTSVNRWDENAGSRRDAIRSQVIDALEAQEIKETGNLISSDFNNGPISMLFFRPEVQA
jgi:hypothetical protein